MKKQSALEFALQLQNNALEDFKKEYPGPYLDKSASGAAHKVFGLACITLTNLIYLQEKK